MRRNTLRELRAYCRRVGPLIHAFTEALETVFRFLTAYDKREKGKRLSQGDRRLLETWEALFAGHKAVCHDVLPQLGHVKCPPIAAAYHWLIQDAVFLVPFGPRQTAHSGSVGYQGESFDDLTFRRPAPIGYGPLALGKGLTTRLASASLLPPFGLACLLDVPPVTGLEPAVVRTDLVWEKSLTCAHFATIIPPVTC